MNNLTRYLITLAVGFLGGVIAAAVANEPAAEYLRHGLIGMAPALATLQMTLTKSDDMPKAKGAGAGQ